PPPPAPTLSLHDALPISFNPTAPTGTSSTLTVSVGAAVAAGVYNLTVDGTGTPGNRSTPLTLTVSASGVERFPGVPVPSTVRLRSEEHTSELQSRFDLVC